MQRVRPLVCHLLFVIVTGSLSGYQNLRDPKRSATCQNAVLRKAPGWGYRSGFWQAGYHLVW
jgi:hypothetical protein